MAITHNEQSFEKRYFEQERARALGRSALEGAQTEARRRDELISGLAEALDGKVKTHFQFELNKDGYLSAKDQEPTRDMMNRALIEAHKMEAEDSFYSFALERTRIELEELDVQEAMAKSPTDFNTLVTFSPYNEEIATSEANNWKLMRGGQMPAWRRSMLRISHWDGQRMHIITRSIDNSSVELLRRAASISELDYDFAANSANTMLAERILATRDLEGAHKLADNITQTADEILALQNPGQFFDQGRQLNSVDTFSYIQKNQIIIDEILNEGRRLIGVHSDFENFQAAFNDVVYNHTALLEARMKLGSEEPIINLAIAADAAGAIAEAAGIEYSFCGHIVSRQLETSPQTGFESLLRLDGKKIKCPECKTKVVIDRSDLSAGRLACKHCGYGVDVCTGRKFKRNTSAKKPTEKKPDIIDQLVAAFNPKKETKT